MKSTAKNITWILTGVMIILLIINLYTVFSINTIAQDLEEQAKEYTRPAEIHLTTILDSSCTDCFDIQTIAQQIKAENVDILTEQSFEYTDNAAQELIEKYAIEKIPTIIVTGETNKEGTKISGLEDKGDALLFTDLTPVYRELSSNSYRGRVQILLIVNSLCEECYDLTQFVEALKTVLIISEEETRELEDAEEERKAYQLTEVPAIILSGDLAIYTETLPKLEALGSYVGEDLVLTTALNPPYWDIEEELIKGLVKVTYLTDESCEDCYNVEVHKTVLKNYGVYITEEETIDISSEQGQELLEEYNITKVPTIILSEDLIYYTSLIDLWEQVGTVEEDGSYVFRKVELVSDKYKNLEEE